MTICGNCHEHGQTVEHVRACYQGRTIQAQVLADPGNERAAWFGTEFTAPAEPVESGPVTEPGFYQTAGGDIYKVQIAHHGSGRLYAKRLVMTEPVCGGCANGEPCDPPCPPTRVFEYAPGQISRLTAAMRITPEQAKAFSDLYGVCIFCCKVLTDERSIHAGYGEKCASNHGLPWGHLPSEGVA